MNFIPFQDTLKSSRAYSLIKNDCANGLSHAYMVVSSDSATLSDFFRLIAATYYCDTKDACGECTTCNTVTHGKHPDVFFINKDCNPLKVEDVKNITDSTGVKSESGTKLYFVNRADLMNVQAQNKLLKTLEEPPKGVTIFLGVSNEAAMLNTIKSRCRTVYLDMFSVGTIKNNLIASGCDEYVANMAAECAEGQLGRAQQIASSQDFKELYSTAIELLSGLKKSTDIIKYSKNKILLERQADIFDILSIIFADILAIKAQNASNSATLSSQISTLAQDFSARAAAECVNLINEERKKIALNVNKQSVLDNLLFSILEVKYKWR